MSLKHDATVFTTRLLLLALFIPLAACNSNKAPEKPAIRRTLLILKPRRNRTSRVMIMIGRRLPFGSSVGVALGGAAGRPARRRPLQRRSVYVVACYFAC